MTEDRFRDSARALTALVTRVDGTPASIAEAVREMARAVGARRVRWLELDDRGAIGFVQDWRMDRLSLLSTAVVRAEQPWDGMLEELRTGEPIWVERSGRVILLVPVDMGEEVGLFELTEPGAFLRDSPWALLALSVLAQTIAEARSRRRAELAAHDEATMLAAMFSQASVGVALQELDGRFLRVNGALEKMLGYSSSELLAFVGNEITHPDDRPVGAAQYRDLVLGRRDRATVEKRFVRKDGRIAWMRTTASLLEAEDGNPTHTIVLYEDVSETKRVIAQRDVFFRIAPNAMCILDESGKLVAWGRAFAFAVETGEESSAAREASLRGRSFVELLTPQGAARAEKAFARLRRGDNDVAFFRAAFAGKTERPLTWRFALSKEDDCLYGVAIRTRAGSQLPA